MCERVAFTYVEMHSSSFQWSSLYVNSISIYKNRVVPIFQAKKSLIGHSTLCSLFCTHLHIYSLRLGLRTCVCRIFAHVARIDCFCTHFLFYATSVSEFALLISCLHLLHVSPLGLAFFASFFFSAQTKACFAFFSFIFMPIHFLSLSPLSTYIKWIRCAHCVPLLL